MRGLRTRVRTELDRQIARVQSAGRGSPGRPKKASTHMEWLVRKQVRRESYNEIARDLELDATTVSDAVKSRAAEIGLQIEK